MPGSRPTKRRPCRCKTTRLLAYVAARGWTAICRIEDIGSEAEEHPQRAELMKLARGRALDVVVVWRLDRWGYSMADLVQTLQELNALGVGFVSLSEPLDLTTPSGRAMSEMLVVFAEFERKTRRERVKAGISRALDRGGLMVVPRPRRVRRRRFVAWRRNR